MPWRWRPQADFRQCGQYRPASGTTNSEPIPRISRLVTEAPNDASRLPSNNLASVWAPYLADLLGLGGRPILGRQERAKVFDSGTLLTRRATCRQQPATLVVWKLRFRSPCGCASSSALSQLICLGVCCPSCARLWSACADVDHSASPQHARLDSVAFATPGSHCRSLPPYPSMSTCQFGASNCDSV